jgi:hypothetical protein
LTSGFSTKPESYLCEANPAGENNITGRMHYYHCETFNKDGDCEDFKPYPKPRFRDWVYVILIITAMTILTYGLLAMGAQ